MDSWHLRFEPKADLARTPARKNCGKPLTKSAHMAAAPSKREGGGVRFMAEIGIFPNSIFQL